MNLFAPVHSTLRRFGIQISRISQNVGEDYPIELTEFERDVLTRVKPLTMTSTKRLSGLALAVRYLNENNIVGDFVECGVWAGGSIGATALLGVPDNLSREYWLFDTFTGMTRPGIYDELEAKNRYLATKHADDDGSTWCEVDKEQVQRNLADIGVDLSNCRFIVGDVSKTLVSQALPKKIALLRLDTDWYESTMVELEVLFPKLTVGGVLIIDDYGDWEGSRKAVEEYFRKQKARPLLIPLDHTGRICIKI
jgi:hypothetical protein